ncbi:MAG: DUF3422 domain-containing protein [Pseudomonadota bacterium]
MPIKNHPQRYALSHELHARPFPLVQSPGSIYYIALSSDGNAKKDHKALADLLAFYDAPVPANGANHHFAELGRFRLKWERHTEFVTYTLISDANSKIPFSGEAHGRFPEDWLKRVKGNLITSATVRIEGPMTLKDGEKKVLSDLRQWFVGESTAVSYVLEKEAIVASDFRIDEFENVRMSIFAIGQVGSRRLGRITQRLLEIETYKSMAMLTLPIARDVFAKIPTLNTKLNSVVSGMTDDNVSAQSKLDTLMELSAKLETLHAEHAYRFSAAKAYSAIVNQRIEVLREDRVLGRQTFAEFMMRRFEPAMRTCVAAENALNELTERVSRAADLLGTRVSVLMNEQNQVLLAQMDNRAAMQLRLQQTVEGLSVVAISYYGVNLLAYVVIPFAEQVGMNKIWATAALVPPVVLGVWAVVRTVRRTLHK